MCTLRTLLNRKKSTSIKSVMTKEDIVNTLNHLDTVKKVINRPVQVVCVNDCLL